MTRFPLSSAVVALGILSLGATLAGCSPTPSANDSDASAAANTQDGPVGQKNPDSKYKDGRYTETGEYTAPSGTESIDVRIDLVDDKVTGVYIVGGATCCSQGMHQAQFAQGLDEIILGKNIDDLDVHVVGGSSLTSEGFAVAIEEIKADAAR